MAEKFHKPPPPPSEPESLKRHRNLRAIEKDWRRWLMLFCGPYITADFGTHHAEFWEWTWSIKKNQRPRSWVSVWPRAGAKSVSAELAVVALGARGIRRYGLYISDSQDLADRHLESIGERLESEAIALFYPALSDRAVGKFGPKGWRRNRLHTRAGFVIDALGLDAASRGIRVDVQRPDLAVIDDIDDSLDAEDTTARKIESLTRRILPALTPDAAILAIQNLVSRDGLFAQLVDGRATFLADRIVSGPIPAVHDLTYETRLVDDRPHTIITGGTASWSGFDLEKCQQEIDTVGITTFLAELQHETPDLSGGMFDHVAFRHCAPAEVPHLDKVVCWVDPALTDRKESDSNGIQIDGISRDKTLYRLWSWEERATPQKALQLAIRKAHEYGATYVGIETDAGSETWRSVWNEQIRILGPQYEHLQFRQVKASAGFGGKAHRASQMLSDYERGAIVHVEGTHHILERALIRFPRTKPYDLVDASFYGWWDLRRLSRPISYASAVGQSLAANGPRPVVTGSITTPRDPRGRIHLVPMRRD